MMTFEKIAFAQRVLRAASRSLEKSAGLDRGILGVGKGLLGAGAAVGKGAWNIAGRGADSMFSQGSKLKPILKPVAQVGMLGMGGAGVYAAGKEGIAQGKAHMIGFDPNVQGYSRQQTNPQYSYQGVG